MIEEINSLNTLKMFMKEFDTFATNVEQLTKQGGVSDHMYWSSMQNIRDKNIQVINVQNVIIHKL